MQVGLVGLGRMGGNMARRIAHQGHDVIGWDLDPAVSAELAAEGVLTAAADIPDLVGRLAPPRFVWLMIPAAFVAPTVERLLERLESGDCVIDGGNSNYRDAVDRAGALAGRGVQFVDVGVSGGVWGLTRGYCLMVGGDQAPVSALTPIFRALAPGASAAPRLPSRRGAITAAEEGWLHCGPAGAGHFVKMIHNGIEYGIMAAFAEGFAILERADIGLAERTDDAETAPLREPEYYRFDLDLPAIAELWRRGSVVESWLLDLTAESLAEDPTLASFQGRVSDSGEGRWTVQAAIDEGVPANVLASALHQRFSSRDLGDYGDRLLSAMRARFGGHIER